MKWLRRALLEFWAMLFMAGVVGFLGPFGTYLAGDFISRFGRWLILLLGAYVLVRPIMILWRWIAEATSLPRGSMVFWGVILCSFPMAFLWQWAGRDEMKLLGGYSGVLPFTLLCSLAIMAVAWWAGRADAHLLLYYAALDADPKVEQTTPYWSGNLPAPAENPPLPTPEPGPGQPRPRLYARLTPRFEGPILALESEDHYVRVHGMHHSELLLLRLRDAIAEMDEEPGEQTHRSWWVARGAVAQVVGTGRNREIELVNGKRAPVARDSIERLTRSQFLPA
ncbi:hypothetical protein GCM10009087_27820 [Sphingomonas oligophenolica]|uniref:LytTR family DNA-binding domain-containing protein n=1 Tax=Sphingomonas oligophenolica TaxID=301154 RepID=A0ABU9Y4I5_9SPHN